MSNDNINENVQNELTTILKLYFSGHYIFITILLSVLLKKIDYIYWILNLIIENNLSSILIILNLLGLYITLYKIKFNLTFSIGYN